MDIRKTRAYKYALSCVNDDSGRTPKYVKLQAAEWIAIADGERDYARVSMSRIKLARRIMKLMVHPDLQCCVLLFCSWNPV